MPGKITGLCTICSTKDAVYRCPKCSIIYCSLTCYKGHKESCSTSVESSKTFETAMEVSSELVAPPLLQFTEEENEKDRVKYETLQKLGISSRLKDILGNKHLRDMLIEIDTSQTPSKTLEKAMQIPIFTEFVDECLSVVEPDEVDEMKINEQKEIEHIKELLENPEEYEEGEVDCIQRSK